MLRSRHTNTTSLSSQGSWQSGLWQSVTRPRARHRYCGKEKDAESGLYYYGARYYESWTCRFVSVDPLAEKYAQLSSYNYADNSPVTDLDIDGLQGTGSVPGPPLNQKSDNTSVKDAVRVNPVAKTPVHGTINAPANKTKSQSLSTSVEVNNLVPKQGNASTPEAEKRLKNVMFPKYDHGTIRQAYTKEEVRAEAIKKTAWAWGPYAAIGGGILAAPLAGSVTVGSGTVTTMAIKGGANLSSQLLEHNFNYNKVDVVDVGLAAVPSIKGLSATQMALLTNSVSGALDVTVDGKVKAVGINKSAESAGVDAVGGFIGNQAGRKLASSPTTVGLNPEFVEAFGGETVSTASKAVYRKLHPYE